MSTPPSPSADAHKPPFAEFVMLIAATMAMTALSINIMLPAFSAIGAHYGVTDSNRLQYLIFAYLIGFVPLQLVYGPLSDSIGRRPVILIGFVIYCVGALLAMTTSNFSMLILSRALQGAGGAAARVVAIAIVRDRYAGAAMARVMSFTMMVFIVVPVFAPAVGTALIATAGWASIFLFMIAAGLAVGVWFALRMPETLPPHYQRPLSFASVIDGFRITLSSRRAVGYATGTGLMLGPLYGYIGSSAQIFDGLYHLGAMFPVVFAAIAGGMGLASVANSHLVGLLGTHRMAHLALFGFVAAAILQTGIAIGFDGHPPVVILCGGLALNQFLFAMTTPNFNAIALEELGAVSGSASSFVGFYAMALGVLGGTIIGQLFDGTVTPLALGYLGTGIICVIVMLITERGRLMRPPAVGT